VNTAANRRLTAKVLAQMTGDGRKLSKLDLRLIQRICAALVMSGLLNHCHMNYEESKELTKLMLKALLH
jgi:hypothetical protein